MEDNTELDEKMTTWIDGLPVTFGLYWLQRFGSGRGLLVEVRPSSGDLVAYDPYDSSNPNLGLLSSLKGRWRHVAVFEPNFGADWDTVRPKHVLITPRQWKAIEASFTVAERDTMQQSIIGESICPQVSMLSRESLGETLSAKTLACLEATKEDMEGEDV